MTNRRATAQPEPMLDAAELERALEEEARAGEPNPEADVAYSAPATVAQAPDPAREELDEETAIQELPSAEVSDVVGDVLPPRSEYTPPELVDEEAVGLDIQEPEEIIEPIELPDRELTEEEKAQVLAWLGEERIQELERAIDETYEEVRLKVGDNESIATDCYNKLLRARDIVVRHDAARLAQAEYYVELVRARLRRATQSEVAAKKFQWRILVWSLFWFAAFLAILILLNESWFLDVIIPAGTGNTLVNVEIFLSTMIWGGIGGVVAALYSLFKHVGRRDFDVHFNLSYIGKPFLGLILGATTYMVFNLLVRTLGILPGASEDVELAVAPGVAPGVMYLVAWFSGFKENRIFDLMDGMMRQIFPSGKVE